MIACVRLPAWPAGEAGEALVERLAARVPRLAVEPVRALAWADVHGLPALEYGRRLAVAAEGTVASSPASAAAGTGTVSVGVADTAVVAEVAARVAGESSGGERIARVESGEGRTFLAPLSLAVLEPVPRLAALLEGVGVTRCGELAALEREPVEVRFGAEGVALWRRARDDAPRLLFGASPESRPGGGIDFVDYVVTDPARLLFTANALLGPLCERLRARGEHARRLVLELSLANGEVWRRTLRAARPTASRERWLRRLRTTLERLTVGDAVAGVRLSVAGLEPAGVEQGDLFDRGFATAAAVEAAVARLAEAQGTVFVTPSVDGHPLAERAVTWVEREVLAPGAARVGVGTAKVGVGAAGPGGLGSDAVVVGTAVSVSAALALQLLPEPRRIAVKTVLERGQERPARYRDGSQRVELVTAAGPDRVSGGQWARPFAREYFRCVTADGALVWIYHDARDGGWYMQGWWD